MPQNLAGLAGPNPIWTLAGVNILTSFTAGPIKNAVLTPMQIGRAERVRFLAQIILANGSPITSVTVKHQRRYNDFDVANPTTLPYTDLYSVNDSNNATSPVGAIEVSHTFNLLVAPIVAPGVIRDWYIDRPYGLLDTTVMISANAQGIAGDSVAVFMTLT